MPPIPYLTYTFWILESKKNIRINISIYHLTLSGAGKALTRGSKCTFLPSTTVMNFRLLWVTLRNGCSVGTNRFHLTTHSCCTKVRLNLCSGYILTVYCDFRHSLHLFVVNRCHAHISALVLHGHIRYDYRSGHNDYFPRRLSCLLRLKSAI